MTYYAKVTSKGQVTLPAEMRSAAGIEPGDRLRIETQADGSYRVTRVSDSLMDLAGIIKLDRHVSDEEMRQWIEDARYAIGTGDDRS